MNTIEIPIKKVNISKIINNNSVVMKTKINNNTFIGTDCLFIKEDIASKSFKNRIYKRNDIKKVNDDTFNYMINDYNFTEKDINNFDILEDDTFLIIYINETYKIGVNYNYYSYFKKFGIQLKFKDKISPIGLFKNNSFVGIILPVMRH